MEKLPHLYSSRIRPVDLPTARRMGVLSDRARGRGIAPGWADLAIAATAQGRGCTILTRNLGHFDKLDVSATDPFETLPADAG